MTMVKMDHASAVHATFAEAMIMGGNACAAWSNLCMTSLCRIRIACVGLPWQARSSVLASTFLTRVPFQVRAHLVDALRLLGRAVHGRADRVRHAAAPHHRT
jgi:hypothetical protein